MDKRLKKEERKVLFVCVHAFFTHSQEALWPQDLCSLPGWMPFQRPAGPLPTLRPSLWLLSALGQAQCPIPPPDTMKLCLEPHPGFSQGGAPGSALQTPTPQGPLGSPSCSPSRYLLLVSGSSQETLATGVQGSNRPRRPCQPSPAPAQSPGARTPSDFLLHPTTHPLTRLPDKIQTPSYI